MEAVMARETAEWSASPATMALEETSPRSLAEGEEEDDEEDEEEEEWAERPPRRSRQGLRALLKEMDDSSFGGNVSLGTRRLRQEEEEEEEYAGEEGRGGHAAQAELRLAEERVRSLEARLLDAEETIYHLKAEKMEAWRRVEKLSVRSSGAEGSRGAGEEEDEEEVETLRSQVEELERRLREASAHHAVELEERMAVIREQERELLVLKDRLTDAEERAEDAEAQYETLRRSVAEHALQREKHEAQEMKGEEDNDPVQSLLPRSARASSSSSARASSSSSATAWQEELVRHPTPHFDLASAEVQYLLCAWTKNATKLQYLRTWLTHVAQQHARELPPDFPRAIELPRLAPEIRDGFLTLVVPLLRRQPWRELHVHTRPSSDAFHSDLRVRVEPRTP